MLNLEITSRFIGPTIDELVRVETVKLLYDVTRDGQLYIRTNSMNSEHLLRPMLEELRSTFDPYDRHQWIELDFTFSFHKTWLDLTGVVHYGQLLHFPR